MRWHAQRRFPSRDAWLAARQIGSSDVARILRRPDGRPVSPYGGAYAVWRRLIGRPLPRVGRPEQERGRRFEPVVAAAYVSTTGRNVRQPPAHALYVGPEPWGTSSPDRFTRDGDEWGPLELKTDASSSRSWGPSQVIERWDPRLWRNGPPVRRDYYLQCALQMWVLDAPWCELAVLLPWYDVRVYRIQRDRAIERAMVGRLGAWWRRHVEGGVPVPREASEEELLELGEELAPAPGQTYRARLAQPEEVWRADQLARVRTLRKGAELTERHLQHQLIASAGRASALLIGRDGRGGRISIVRGASGAPHVRLSGPIAEPTTTQPAQRSAA